MLRGLLVRTSAASQHQIRYQTSSAVELGKVYELRTYAIWPQYLKDFLNLTSEEFHLRTSQSKLIGYWTSELGGLNEVVHIWEYGILALISLLKHSSPIKRFLNFPDSLEHRAQVRASLATNSEWIQRYFAKILPWMSGQQNSVISVIPGIAISNSSEKGVYQLQSLNFNLNSKEKLLQNFSKSNTDGFLVGAFQTLHGNLNTSVLLWKHPSLTAASRLVSNQLKSIQLNFLLIAVALKLKIFMLSR